MMISDIQRVENLRISETLASLRASFYDCIKPGFSYIPEKECFTNAATIKDIMEYQLREEMAAGEIQGRIALVSNGPLRRHPWPFVLNPRNSLLRASERDEGQTSWTFHAFYYLRVYGKSPAEVVLDTSIREDLFANEGEDQMVNHAKSLFRSHLLLGRFNNLYLVDTPAEVVNCLDRGRHMIDKENVEVIKAFTRDNGGYWGKFSRYTD